ncbi:MAG: DNA methyltransferase [Candidatus Marinimicrobia bacterium]|nr:DNA methyltransferase [Candidatus Neomarinimicrobiota bacterium]
MYVPDVQIKTALNISKSRKNLFRNLLMSNLNFGSDKKTQNPRHYWHSFPAKFPPDLPRLFIENLTSPGQVVLDPMAGSCTTLIEASMMNRLSYGFDIDPLSFIIGNAKLHNYDLSEVKTEGYKILTLSQFDFEFKREELTNDLNSRFDKETLLFLDYWWLKETQIELLSLIRQIEKVTDEKIRNFLKLVFSSIIITKSGGVTRSRDLAHTRPHRVEDKLPNSAFTEFGKKLIRILDNGYRNLPTKSILQIGNTKSLPLKDRSVDLIVTSPPYANNAIDYMRAHKFSLVWFGDHIDNLKNTRKQYIGAETLIQTGKTELPKYSQKIVRTLSELNPNKGKALHRYYCEMYDVIKEMHRVLRPQSACIIVVATSILNGLDVNTHQCLAEIGQSVGFDLVHIGERTIHRDSRMLPTSHLKNGSQIEARMHNEFIIGLWKESNQ